MTVDAHGRRRRRRRLDGLRRRAAGQRGDRVRRRRRSRCPGTLAVTATGGRAATATSTGFVVLTRGTDVAPHPVLVRVVRPEARRRARRSRSRSRASTAARRSAAPSLVTRYRYPTGGDATYPGPERVYRVHVTGRRRELRRRRALGARDPARHVRRRRGSPRRLHRACRSTSTRTARRYGAGVPRRRRRPARRRASTTSSSTRARPRRRPVHVPLLGERRDAADAARRLDEGRRSPSRRPTPARASIRRRSSRRSTASAVAAATRRDDPDRRRRKGAHALVAERRRLPGDEEHGGRRRRSCRTRARSGDRRRPLARCR